LIDDWRPSKEMPFNMMLGLMDRYPFMVESKGATTHFTSKILVITNPLHPKDLLDGEHYDWVGKEAKQQFLRRMDEIKQFGEVVVPEPTLPANTYPSYAERRALINK
jgi:hypothetical protein